MADTLRCMILLEEAAADFYDRLSRTVRIAECSAALAFVAKESSNHAALLKNLFGEPSPEKCASILGSIGSATLLKLKEIAAKLDAGWTPSHKQVAELLEEINDLERFAGEEVYNQVAAAVLSSQFTKFYRVLLLSIAEEEKWHFNIVKGVIEELKRLSETIT